MLSCSIWFSVPSFWIGGGLEKTICCNSTSNAPDDGRMYLKTCRAKNTLIKLPCCVKLASQIISQGRCTVKQPSSQLDIQLFEFVCLFVVFGPRSSDSPVSHSVSAPYSYSIYLHSTKHVVSNSVRLYTKRLSQFLMQPFNLNFKFIPSAALSTLTPKFSLNAAKTLTRIIYLAVPTQSYLLPTQVFRTFTNQLLPVHLARTTW